MTLVAPVTVLGVFESVFPPESPSVVRITTERYFYLLNCLVQQLHVTQFAFAPGRVRCHFLAAHGRLPVKDANTEQNDEQHFGHLSMVAVSGRLRQFCLGRGCQNPRPKPLAVQIAVIRCANDSMMVYHEAFNPGNQSRIQM